MDKPKKIQLFVFKNDQKNKETQPDYHVNAKIGDKYENLGAGWIQASKQSGKKFISISIEVEKIRPLINQELSTSAGQEVPFPKQDEEWI